MVFSCCVSMIVFPKYNVRFPRSLHHLVQVTFPPVDTSQRYEDVHAQLHGRFNVGTPAGAQRTGKGFGYQKSFRSPVEPFGYEGLQTVEFSCFVPPPVYVVFEGEVLKLAVG